MPHHIAFLHTAAVHIATFDRICQTVDPALRVEHIVDEELLADAQRVGAADTEIVQRVQTTMWRAAAQGASLVVCTCSTIGGAAERTPTRPGFAVARIDRAMADRAVALGPRVLVVAALESTLGPTTELIRESAAASGTPVDIQHRLVADAWPHFQRGDRAAYLNAVVAAVRATTLQADAIVLAQASMADAADALRDLGVELLSSPLLGVHAAVAQLRAQG
jgi:hypothetical protein